MKITDFKQLDSIIQKIKSDRYTNAGFLFNGHSYRSITTYIDKCCKRIAEVNANLALLNAAYKSANNEYTQLTWDDRKALREKTGKDLHLISDHPLHPTPPSMSDRIHYSCGLLSQLNCPIPIILKAVTIYHFFFGQVPSRSAARIST